MADRPLLHGLRLRQPPGRHHNGKYSHLQLVCISRDARSDLEAVLHELTSLSSILELICADSETSQSGLPETIVRNLCNMLSNCNDAVTDNECVFRKYEGAVLLVVYHGPRREHQ